MSIEIGAATLVTTPTTTLLQLCKSQRDIRWTISIMQNKVAPTTYCHKVRRVI
jgi:hypothetical protein